MDRLWISVDNSVDNVENIALNRGKNLWTMWIKLWISVDKPVDIFEKPVEEVCIWSSGTKTRRCVWR